VLDILEASNVNARYENSSAQEVRIAGVADDNPSPKVLQRLAARRIQYLGTTDDVIDNSCYQRFLVGIGNPAAKALIDTKFTNAGWRPISAVHPHASIGSNSSIGEGSIICGGVQLST